MNTCNNDTGVGLINKFIYDTKSIHTYERAPNCVRVKLLLSTKSYVKIGNYITYDQPSNPFSIREYYIRSGYHSLYIYMMVGKGEPITRLTGAVVQPNFLVVVIY